MRGIYWVIIFYVFWLQLSTAIHSCLRRENSRREEHDCSVLTQASAETTKSTSCSPRSSSASHLSCCCTLCAALQAISCCGDFQSFVAGRATCACHVMAAFLSSEQLNWATYSTTCRSQRRRLQSYTVLPFSLMHVQLVQSLATTGHWRCWKTSSATASLWNHP